MSEHQRVRSAVIAAAGSATRMWPASKVVPKELFPLGKLPAIVRILSELAEAAISRVVIVTSDQAIGLIQGLFDRSLRPPAKVLHDPEVMNFESILDRTEITIVRQAGNYGNATPLIQSSSILGVEPCLYAFGDDIVIGENASAALIKIYERTGFPVLGAQIVPYDRRMQFGILECRDEYGIQYVTRMLEKPQNEDTTSNLASFGRYVVTPDLMEVLLHLTPGRDQETWFADSVIQRLREGGPVCAATLSQGRWYTVGDPTGYAEAVAAVHRETR